MTPDTLPSVALDSRGPDLGLSRRQRSRHLVIAVPAVSEAPGYRRSRPYVATGGFPALSLPSGCWLGRFGAGTSRPRQDCRKGATLSQQLQLRAQRLEVSA
eukprot:scaffold838_cov251-Pinguiococcus_pyrenoidosus.AAC.1